MGEDNVPARRGRVKFGRSSQLSADQPASGPSAVLVDFFSGCGGTSSGFLRAGILPVGAVDIDLDAAATYRRNFPNALMLVDDIKAIPIEAFEKVLAPHRAVGRSLIFSGCAPCQPFSKQRRGEVPNDARADLLAELLRFVSHYRPDAIFLENVPGLQARAARYGPFRRLLRSLRGSGYRISYRTVESRHYGVPQRRKRLVMLASRHGRIEFPVGTHGPGGAPFITVREAIGSLPAVAAGASSPTMNAHQAANLSKLNLARIAATPEGGGRVDWPAELTLACHLGRPNSYTDAYGRLRWDEPAPALTTRCISYSNGRFGHPSQDRAITAREAAFLQTFPAEFMFEGTLTSVARQVGNAVPVVLAASFATSIAEHLAIALRAARTAA